MADHAARGAQATRLVATRVALVAGVVGAVRAGLVAAVAGATAALRGQVVAVRARVQAVVTAVVTTVQRLVAGSAVLVTAQLASAAGAVAGTVTRLVAVAGAAVRAAAARVTGLIGAVSLPDVPGVAAVRDRATRFLADAAAYLTGRLAQVTAAVQGLARTALQVVGSVVESAAGFVRGVVGGVATGLRSLADRVAALLLRAAGGVAAALQRALAVLVLPALARVQGFVVGRLRWALAHALRLLQRNRDRQLEVLDELDVLRPAPRVGSGAAPPPDPETTAEAERVVRDARTNSARVLRVLDLATGGAVGAVLARVRAVAVRVRSELGRRLARAVARMQALATFVTTQLRLLVGTVTGILLGVVAQVHEAVTRIVETARSLVQAPLDLLVSAAAGAVTAARDAVLALVRDLVAGVAAVVADVRSLLGDAPRAGGVTELEPDSPVLAKGPITKPPPGTIVKPILIGIAFLFAVVGYLVLVVASELTVVGSFVAFLLALGLTEFWVLVVVGVVALVLLALALLLLVLLVVLVKTILRRIPRPVKRVLRVTPARLEVGVGGRDLAVSATIAPGLPVLPSLRWTINPGGAAPAGIAVRPRLLSTRTADVRASHPPHGTVTGGTALTVRAALASNPGDFADAAGILVVQVTEAEYVAAPPLATGPPHWGPFPPNTVDPVRDGVPGSTAAVVATTAPAGRAIAVTLRRPLGATVAGAVITPGVTTGNLLVRVTEPVTGARLDETRPSLRNPPVTMSTLVVNSVATKVTGLNHLGRVPGAGPYSAFNQIVFRASDSLRRLDRVVGELITGISDDFNIAPPNPPIGFNHAFHPDLAVPGHTWRDQVTAPAMEPNQADGLPAIDLNRFVGPGVPQLPRSRVFRQQMVWAAWRAGNIASVPFADGRHVRTLLRRGSAFEFSVHHTFPGVAARPPNEAYAGPPLIFLTRVVVTPDAPGATALAADGLATGQAQVTTTVAGRQVQWTVLAGDISVPAGNPSSPPGTATVQAGVTTGRFGLRAADTVHGNRRGEGRVTVQAVQLRRMSATRPGSGTTSTVSVTADPGGRVVDWALDPAAVAAGVTVTPTRTGPGPAVSSVLVTRPAGFRGTVTVTATDSVLAAATARTSVRFA